MTPRATLLTALAAGLLAVFATVLPGQAAAGKEAARDVAVRCGTLLTGDGTTVLHDVWLLVRKGKVVSIETTAPPAGVRVIDASNKVVMPGIVAVDSDLSAAADSDYQVTPDALAVDAFDFSSKLREELEGGVTTVYLSPGRQRLVSGQGAVIKTNGDDIVERILDEHNCLRIDFGDSAVKAPRVFEPNAHPTSEQPLEPSRIQTPTSRISLLPELRALLAEATAHQAAAASGAEGANGANATAPSGQGPAQHQYDDSALALAATGKLMVRAAAFRTHDVRRALALQAERGLRMVLEDPQEIAPVAGTAAAQKVAATFRVPIRFGMPYTGGEDRQQVTLEPRPDAPAKAAAAGMMIGLSPANGISSRDYLMAIAIAVGHGLPVANALRSIGADAATILGVGDRVGTLAAGRDADFIIMSGDPLAVGTMVESTWIDGERAWHRVTKQKDTVLAVRCGRILDATGRVYRNGVILTQNGRIKAVGEDLAIPYGAEVIDFPEGVMTPGFIDAFSHLGLAGDGAPVPQGNASQRVHDAVDHDDPMFEPALQAGLTTLLVSGKDSGPISGRIAALKTGARDRDGMVVRAVAGLRMAHDAIGPDAIKPLADQIGRGKAYVKQWNDYEKALLEWKTGKKAEPAKVEKPEETKDEAEAADPVTGVWEAEIDIQGQIQIKITLNLNRSGKNVTGTIVMSFAGRDMPARDISSGSYEAGKLVLEFRGMGPGGDAKLEATLKGDTMTGKVSMGRMGDQDINATRTSKEAPKTGASRRPSADKPTEDGKPKAPKVDENLEPLRAAIEKRGALVIKTKRAAAIADVIELLEKEAIPYVLEDVDDLVDDPAIAGDKHPRVLVGPEVIDETSGELQNLPAIFADRGQQILFGSGECGGARFLPLHVTYAVRYGLSPSDALSALTIWPAQAFHLDDRIGSLEKGKDADFAVFSGNPFEPQSRMLLVVCNGQVVVDNRKNGDSK